MSTQHSSKSRPRSKKKESNAQQSDDDWAVFLDLHFPPLPPGVIRLIFVDAITPERIADLAARGYTVRHLGTMPRESDEDRRLFLLAKAQGIEEGLVDATKAQIEALKLQMHAAGLLDKRSTGFGDKDKGKLKVSEVLELLSWGRSQHTLRGNSTVQSAASLGPSSAQDHAEEKPDHG